MMADEIINGVASNVDDQVVDSTEEEDQSGNSVKVHALMQKIAGLEQEKQGLIHENGVVTDRIKKLEDEIEASERDKMNMKSEIERSEVDKKALDSIAARAAELETEVSRLQHDLISSMAEGQEANAELSELKRVVEDLRKSDSEKGTMFEVVEKERNLLLERMDKDSEGAKQSKAESEDRIRDLEKKIEALEVRESNYKSERVKVEEEARAKIDEKEDRICTLKRLIDEFQLVIARNRVDMERSNKEREELEIVKNDLEALLKKSERKVKEMEQKMDQSRKELEASEKMVSALKEKTVGSINGKGGVVVDRSIVLGEEKRLMGLKLEWPVLAASAGAIAAVAVVYLRYARQT